MSNLRQKQWYFLLHLADLIQYAHARKWELTLGEGFIDLLRVTEALADILGRGPTDAELRMVYGHKLGGAHPSRLAVDLNLFIDGQWIPSDYPAWHDLGNFWLTRYTKGTLDDLPWRWGGNFTDAEGKPVGDFNHFSLEHEGRA